MNPKFIFLDSIDSTNTDAKRRIEHGAISELKQPVVIVSDVQTHGRGRGAHEWCSQLGGLYYTLVCSPMHLHSQELSHLSREVGKVVCSVVSSLTDLSIELEWPNDLIFQNKKVGGILIESMSASSDSLPRFLIVGIGLNLNQESFPPPLDISAGSLRQFGLKTYNRQDFIEGITKELLRCL